jgi:hypothetical protein
MYRVCEENKGLFIYLFIYLPIIVFFVLNDPKSVHL